MVAKKWLVDDKITACVKQIYLLGVICKVSTEKHCLVKQFALLKKVFLSTIQFCASSNLLFLYELLFGTQLTFFEYIVISCNPIGQLCLSGPGYRGHTVSVPLA